MIVHVLISEMVGYIHAEQMESRNHTDYSRFLFVIYDKKLCADQLICGNWQGVIRMFNDNMQLEKYWGIELREP